MDKGIVKVRTYKAKRVICHPQNRGKLGLNPYNVHRNGAEIVKVGYDPKEMAKAAAFEICPLDQTKINAIWVRPASDRQIEWPAGASER